MIELGSGAFKIALVVIGDTVLSTNELCVSCAVTAVLKVVRGAFALVEESLSLASENALILEGFHFSGTDWLGNGGATTRTETGGL